jgi:hypothetical protein
MVTHDANHAARTDRIIYLRDGRIVEERSPSGGCKPPESALGGLTPPARDGTETPVNSDFPCVEWSVAPSPCPFSAVSFVAPCARDALEHGTTRGGLS